MAEPIVFISRHRVKEGKHDTFRAAYADGARSIETGKPGTVAFLSYLDVDEEWVTTIHVFPDADAMDAHFEGADERAAGAAEFLEFKEFQVYGRPSDAALSVLETAGNGGVDLAVDPTYVTGYLRLELREEQPS